MTQDSTQLPSDQLEKLTAELTRLHQEVSEIRTRVARLEQERAEKAAESLEASF